MGALFLSCSLQGEGECLISRIYFSGGKKKHHLYVYVGLTVDGRKPAPVDMENIPLFIGFYTSQVVRDFSHQQYFQPPNLNLVVGFTLDSFGFRLVLLETKSFIKGSE